MLKKGEIVKIQKGDNLLEVEIVDLINITVNRRWYEFDINAEKDAPADYRIEENYIGKTVNNAGETLVGNVCKHLYVNDNDDIIATEIVSYI